VPGYDAQLFKDLGDKDVSIEDSVAFRDGVVYFSNSGGLVQGWDIRDILRGGTRYERVFRFWDGDETDASIAIDDQGYLYVGRHASFPGPTWMSPVPVDGQILVGDCSGVLHDFDISSPHRRPTELWRVQLSGCVESTPAVWDDRIYVGTRGGAIYGIGDP